MFFYKFNELYKVLVFLGPIMLYTFHHKIGQHDANAYISKVCMLTIFASPIEIVWEWENPKRANVSQTRPWSRDYAKL